ncbi:4-fold beta flower protein [Lutispora sp.]|uniref:5-fold beta-flower protein n=1 Tax=Lutispora sp. TaxID=2828727 RepID=UPI003562D1FE
MERFYDSRGTLYGYVDNDTIFDCCGRVMGYTDGCRIFDAYRRPLAYIDRGNVYSSNGARLGYYNSRNYRLYDMDGNYLGYGNSGFRGLLGAILLLLLFRPFNRFFF